MRSFLKNRTFISLIVFAFAAILLVAPVSNVVEAKYAPGATEAAEAANAENKTAGGCDWWNFACHIEKGVSYVLGLLFLTLGGFILWVGGSLFTLSLSHFALGMGWWVNEGGIGLVIDDIWSIVRDVVNLAFIFGFVYIGLNTILFGGSGYRKFLAQLVIAALLVNFSLFFVKVVIDVANIAAIEVHELMGASDIPASFVSAMGISSFYGINSIDPEMLARLNNPGTGLTFVIMAFLFLVITGVTFMAAAVMLIVRFVALIFLMIGSPLYFALMIFPKASKLIKFDIFSLVINYAFYPVIFLFLLYISLRIMQTSTFSGDASQLINTFGTGSIPTDPNAFMILLQFAVAIALIITSLRVAKNFSLFGANAVIDLAQKSIGGMTAGVTSAGLRGTLGRWSNAAANDKDLKDRAATSWVAKKQLQLASATSKASFDARGIKAVGKLGYGDAQKGGYVADVEKAKKEEEEFAKLLGTVDDDDIKVQAQQQRSNEMEGELQTLKKRKNEAAEAAEQNKNRINKAEESLENLRERADYETDPAKKAALQLRVRDKERSLADLEKVRDDLKNEATTRDANISLLEETLPEQKNKIDREKNRRILGSSFISDEAETAIRAQQNLIKTESRKFKSAALSYQKAPTDAEKHRYEAEFNAAKKAIREAKEAEQQIRKSDGARGYADRVEDMNQLITAFKGRNRGINRKISQALRTEYGKK